MKKLGQAVIGLFFSSSIFIAQFALGEVLVSSAQRPVSHSETFQAVMAASDPIPADQVPTTGTFYSAKYSGGGPPMPSSMGFAAWNLGNGNFLVDDLDEDNAAASLSSSGGMMSMMSMSGPPSPGGGGGDPFVGGVTNTFVYTFPTNGLWLDVTNVSGGIVSGRLHHATNYVYAILGCTNLSENVWTPEAEVFPGTSTNSAAFFLDMFDRPAFFLRAHDWTGVTHGGNNVPDWWFWYYFGTTNLTDDTYDSSWVTKLGEDYTNNWVPANTLAFSVGLTNAYSQGSIKAQMNVSAGVAGYSAVVVHSTNYAASANWQPFEETNLLVGLTNEGWHYVWFGLRGWFTNSAPVWQCRHIKVDFTLPVLTITNPTVSAVDLSVIQLSGFSSEDLEALTLDITNSNGLLTNQFVIITGHDFDTNAYEFTTTYFHCYDLALAPGTNTITLHAIDLAGNTVALTTNIVYTTRTNPPAVAMLWPQDGMQICGTNITIKGYVDDPTASVSLSLVDTDGNTNVLYGRTGRDGVFWIENVPLVAATNPVSITLSSASGQTTTNLTLRQSVLALTMNQVFAGQTTVTGTIGASGYTVWVNDVQATNNGSAWTAEIPPICVGGGLIAATAIPNTDNNGYGSANSNSGLSMSGQGSGNPSSASSANAQWMIQAPDGNFVTAFHDQWLMPETLWDGAAWVDRVSCDNFDWSDGGGGVRREKAWWNGYDHSFDYDTVFPATTWPQYAAEVHDFYENYQNWGQLMLQPVQSDYNAAFSDTTRAEYKLATGGPLGSSEQHLWSVNASATTYASPDAIRYNYGFDGWLDPEQITFGDLGRVGPDNYLWVVLPDNTAATITPRGDGADVTKFWFTTGKYSLPIMANGIDISTTTPVFCVGQNVSFQLSDLPERVTATKIQWSLGGTYVNQMIAGSSGASDIYTNNPNLLKQASMPSNWWTSGDYDKPPTYSVSGKCTLVFANDNPNQDYAASGQFAIFKPKVVRFTPSPPFIPMVTNGYLSLGDELTSSGIMWFRADVKSGPGFRGQMNWVQLIQRTTTYAQSTTGFWLDNSLFYNSDDSDVDPNDGGSLFFTDSPGVGSLSWASCTDSFKTYLVFRPNPQSSSIYVTLQLVTWDWWGNEGALQTLTSSHVTPPSNADNHDFPKWTNIIHVRR